MKVKWTLLLDDACGQVDKKHYARHIPEHGMASDFIGPKKRSEWVISG